MLEAERLMANPNLKIQDICFEIGFESVGTFTTQFTKVFGKTPKARQKEILEKKRITVEEPLKTVPNCFAEKQFSRSDTP